MYSDLANIQDTTYSIDSDLSGNGKVVSVLLFLEIHLPEFPEKIKINRNTDERILNQKLLRFLLTKNSLYQFIPENQNEIGINKSKPDFGVYEKEFDGNRIEVYDDNQIRFFDIECKRLYDPNLKHYVKDKKTSGIQRFKENKHGVDLAFSAMITYVETDNFNFWHNKINSWISNEEEHLKILDIQKIAKLKSKHQKNIPNKSIELIHFWLKMNFQNN